MNTVEPDRRRRMSFVERTKNILCVKTSIIGSGVAGIAAANHFLNNDYNDFCVFEALDRIGGRCHSQVQGSRKGKINKDLPKCSFSDPHPNPITNPNSKADPNPDPNALTLV